MRHKREKLSYFLAVVMSVVLGGYLLLSHLNMTESEMNENYNNGNWTGKGTKGASQLIFNSFGKQGIIVRDCVLSLMVATLCTFLFFSEVFKEKKTMQKHLTMIMDLFAQERSHSVSEISSYLKIPEDEVRQLLEQLSAQNKIVRMGDDVYWRYEE